MLDVLAHPGWLRRVMIPHGAPRFENLMEFLPPGAQSALAGVRFMGTQINSKLSWEDMERMRGRWPGKLVLKGILCVEDAQRAVEIGADGIVLSNHGGRQLDSCVSGVELLPAVAAEVGNRHHGAGRRRLPARLGRAQGDRARRARRHDRATGAVRPGGRRARRASRTRSACCARKWNAS